MTNDGTNTAAGPTVRSEPLLDDRTPTCVVCGNSLEWVECDVCDSDGFVDHDCGEDCCCCADPEPNVICGQCDGKGGWWQCYSCTSNNVITATDPCKA
jgi:hypothetical protein